MGDAYTLLESADSVLVIAAQAVTAEALEFREELDDGLANKIIGKLGL